MLRIINESTKHVCKLFASYLSEIAVVILLSCGCSNIDVTDPPRVIGNSPVDGDSHVSVRTVVTVVFSGNIDASTLTEGTFFLNHDVSGSISLRGSTGILTPNQDLEYNTTYTVTITTAIRDNSGTPMDDPYIWSFTTRLEPPAVDSFVPTTGPVGTEVSVYGVRFVPDVNRNRVYFNSTQAIVHSATSTKLVVEVPYGAATGPVSVSNISGSDSSPGIFTLIPAGQIWEVVSTGTDHALRGVVWLENRFIAVGSGSTMMISSDGFHWSSVDVEHAPLLEAITWSGSQAVSVGANGTILTSFDGELWISHESGCEGTFMDVCAIYSDKVAVGTAGQIAFAHNGDKWKPAMLLTSAWLYGVTRFEDRFYAVGQNGIMMNSLDGEYWQFDTTITHNHLLTIESGHGSMIFIGYEGTIWQSYDGSNWDERMSGVTSHLAGIAFGDEAIVVVGEDGTILRSVDGIMWKQQSSHVAVGLYGVAWSGRMFVAVGDDGTIVVSR